MLWKSYLKSLGFFPPFSSDRVRFPIRSNIGGFCWCGASTKGDPLGSVFSVYRKFYKPPLQSIMVWFAVVYAYENLPHHHQSVGRCRYGNVFRFRNSIWIMAVLLSGQRTFFPFGGRFPDEIESASSMKNYSITIRRRMGATVQRWLLTRNAKAVFRKQEVHNQFWREKIKFESR